MAVSEAVESILTETLAQLEQSSKLNKPKDKTTLSFSSMLEIARKEPLEITAIALAEGTWKGVWYSAEVIKKAAEQLQDLEGKVEHTHTIKYKGRDIGKAVKYSFDPELRAIKFKALITDNEAISDVLSGNLKAISMQTFLDRICEKCGVDLSKADPHCQSCGPDARVLAKNLQFVEWSLVHEPACDPCRIFYKSAESDTVNKQHLSNQVSLVSERIILTKTDKTPNLREGEVLALTTTFKVMTEDQAKEEGLPYFKATVLKKLVCPECDAEFDTKEEFSPHWIKVHSDFGKVETKSKDDVIGGDKVTKEVSNDDVVESDIELTDEMLAEEKDTDGCIVGKEVYDQATKECVPRTKEYQSAYTDFMKECIKEKDATIKLCAKKWQDKEQEKSEEKSIDEPEEKSEEKDKYNNTLTKDQIKEESENKVGDNMTVEDKTEKLSEKVEGEGESKKVETPAKVPEGEGEKKPEGDSAKVDTPEKKDEPDKTVVADPTKVDKDKTDETKVDEVKDETKVDKKETVVVVRVEVPPTKVEEKKEPVKKEVAKEPEKIVKAPEKAEPVKEPDANEATKDMSIGEILVMVHSRKEET